MKKALSVFVFLLACFCAWADSDNKVVFEAKFAFTAGGKQLPAGTYAISTDEAGRGFINGTVTPRSGVLLVRSTELGAVGSAEVHFVKRGSRYYLDNVRMPDGRTLEFNSPVFRSK